MNRVLSLGRPHRWTSSASSFCKALALPCSATLHPYQGLQQGTWVCSTTFLSEVHPPNYSYSQADSKAKHAGFHTGTGIHLTDCPRGDRFDHRLMIDRSDFSNHCGKINQGSFVSSFNCKQGTSWQAAALSAHALSVSRTCKYMCVCTAMHWRNR